jgi:glucose dehydrogenase
MYAVNSETGETMWEGDLLGNEGTANPMTYQTSDGQQFIVIGTTGSDSERGLIAFALPDA